MKEKLEAAIAACSAQAAKTKSAAEALHYTQAALNAANALLAISNQNK